MAVVEVQAISNKIEALLKENNSGSEEVTEFLRTLEKLPIDLYILQNSSIGRTVNSLRKETKNAEVAGICKSLVKSWKNLLNPSAVSSQDGDAIDGKAPEPDRKRIKKDGDADAGTKEKPRPASLSRSSSSSSIPSSPTTPTQLNKPVPKVQVAAPISVKSTNGTTFPGSTENGDLTSTSDSTRIRSRELLVKALLKDAPESAALAETIAAETETTIFKEFKNTDVKYKNRIRSRIMSVQDAKNPRLRENILLGHISPKRLAEMTSEEMASKEMKELRDKLSKETVNDRQMVTNGGTETDLLQCGKCKQRKCTYNQVQTRSADEPMTTFVYCTNCGNRWKFC